MKLEQIYKNIREKLNVGDKLWADKEGFVSYVYAPDYEPDTEDEKKVIKALQDYFYKNTGAKDLGAFLKDLLPLKSKFPKLLDPRYSDESSHGTGKPWDNEYEGYAWRGATMKLSELQRLIPQSNLIGQVNAKDPKKIRIDGFAIDDPNYVYKSRGSYGFTSFSLDSYVADNFKGQFDDDRVSVVYGIKLSNPNLIMNPDVSNILSTYAEHETLYVGNKIKPDVIIVTDQRIFDQFKSDALQAGTENPLAYYDGWKREVQLKVKGLGPSFPSPPLKEPTSSTSSLLKKQAAKYNKIKSLEEIYTEIRLSEIGKLEPSKALPFRMTVDSTTLGDEGEVLGKQSYKFKLDDGTEMMAEVSYRNGAAIISFNSVEGAKQGKTPIIGDSYKSAYVITNTVGAILKHSLKDTLKHGKTFEIVVYGKPEWQKKNPFQRQEIYNLFLQKAFPGAKTNKSTLITTLPDNYTEYLNENEVYTEIQLSEVGEGTSEPFEYKENFRKGDTFSYLIDAYTEQDDLERSILIRLQGIAYKERVSDDMEMDRPEYFEFLDKPKGTIINGYEIIFSIADAKGASTFDLVGDKVYMFRLMATIKEILQKEFGSNPPDLLNYSPTKEGSEAVEDTGRHKLYSIFIKKAFPNAKMFVSDEDEEIYFKLK